VAVGSEKKEIISDNLRTDLIFNSTKHSLNKGGWCSKLEVHTRFQLEDPREKTLEIPRRRWEDNVKMDLQEVRRGMDWIDLVPTGTGGWLLWVW